MGARDDLERLTTKGLAQNEGLREVDAFTQDGQRLLIDFLSAVGEAQFAQAFEQEFGFQPGLTLPDGGLLQRYQSLPKLLFEVWTVVY